MNGPSALLPAAGETDRSSARANKPHPADTGAEKNQAKARAGLIPYLFLLPALTALLLFVYGPALLSFIGSFFVIPLAGGPWQFAGINNYLSILGDPLIRQAVGNTLVYALATIIPSMVLGLALALLVERLSRGNWLIKTALILPMTANLVAMAVVFKWMFALEGGLMNQLLGIVGFAPANWLGDEGTSLLAVILVGIWRATSLCMLLFMAGLTTIPGSIHEAAAVEGIRGVAKLRFITLPMLKPTLQFVTVLSITGAVQVFEIVDVMTDGGPLGSSETVLTMTQKIGFEYFRVGEASALSFLLITILLIIGLLGRRHVSEDPK